MENPDYSSLIGILIVSIAVSLLISYFLIRLAVTHGMRSHALWLASPDYETALERRRVRDDSRSAEIEAQRAAIARMRGAQAAAVDSQNKPDDGRDFHWTNKG